MGDLNDKKTMTVEEAAAILSDTLKEVAERKTTVRRASAVARLALAFARVAEISDLKNRVEFLEQALKRRK